MDIASAGSKGEVICRARGTPVYAKGKDGELLGYNNQVIYTTCDKLTPSAQDGWPDAV